MKHKNIFFFILGFIQQFNIVFINDDYITYIRFYSKNLNKLILLQYYLTVIINYFNKTNKIGIIEKKEDYYIYTLKSINDIYYFILILKNNIVNKDLNIKFNMFLYKIYLNPKFKNINLNISICLLKNKIIFEKNNIFKEELLRLKRNWKVWKKKSIKGKYTLINFENFKLENRKYNISKLNSKLKYNKYWYLGFIYE